MRAQAAVSQSQTHVQDAFEVERNNLKSGETDVYGDSKTFEQPVKSAADLGFMTEVDAEYIPAKTRDDSSFHDNAGTTTRMSDMEHASMPYSTVEEDMQEEVAFKNVIKELISKD